MRYINRYSVSGFFVGAIATFAALLCLGLAISRMALKAGLPAPPIPAVRSFYDGLYFGSILRRVNAAGELRLEDLKGRPVFVNYWATWCAPCVAELPAIQKLYEATMGANISFVLISLENEETVRKFLRVRRLTVP